MKTLDEVIEKIEEFWVCPCVDEANEYCDLLEVREDVLHYLKEYKKQKYIWKKLYLLAHQMFWGLEEEYPLDGHSIENDLFDAYSKGFEDEDD